MRSDQKQPPPAGDYVLFAPTGWKVYIIPLYLDYAIFFFKGDYLQF